MTKTQPRHDVVRYRIVKVSLGAAVALILSGCVAGLAPTQPGMAPTQPAASVAPSTTADVPTVVDLLDTSGSVLATDIPAMAQNRLTRQVQTMPVGSRVVLRGVNSNVTAMCQDVVIALPPQPNRAVEDQVRQANQAALPGMVKNYIECSQQQDLGATEFWGGLAETYAQYADATVYVYGDTCENVTIRPGTCSSKLLRDPAFPGQVIAKLRAAGLVPQLRPGSDITFVGIGRNAKLRAGELRALRQIAILWARRAGATPAFDTK